MAIYVAKNGSLQTVKGMYYAMAEDYINATLFHNLVPKTATEIKFLYASDNPDLTGYQKLGYCDNNNNFIEVWNNGTKYILINPKKNYIYAPVSCSSFLNGYKKLNTCIFDNFDTRNTTSMASMFRDSTSLQRLDFSKFNTQNVISMSGMFHNCSRLISLNLSSFNTQSVRDMGGMFYNCTNLQRLNLSNFNTQSVTNMVDMFSTCIYLVTIVANSFSLASHPRAYTVFYACGSLVGGNGTRFSNSHVNYEYARVDGENGLPGYFTAPTN